MKTAIAAIATLFIATTARAQEKGDMAIGGNLVFASGNKYSGFGVGAKFQYSVLNPLRTEGSFSYFFENDLTRMWDVSANAHLMFPVADKASIYPLAGLSVMRSKTIIPAIGAGTLIFAGNTVWHTDYGFNLGGGLDYKFSEKIIGNAELKYRFGNDLNRFLFSVGIAYKL